MSNQLSKLYMASNTTLNLFQDLDVNAGTLEFGANVTLARALYKKIYGSINLGGAIIYKTLD